MRNIKYIIRFRPIMYARKLSVKEEPDRCLKLHILMQQKNINESCSFSQQSFILKIGSQEWKHLFSNGEFLSTYLAMYLVHSLSLVILEYYIQLELAFFSAFKIEKFFGLRVKQLVAPFYSATKSGKTKVSLSSTMQCKISNKVDRSQLLVSSFLD